MAIRDKGRQAIAVVPEREDIASSAFAATGPEIGILFHEMFALKLRVKTTQETPCDVKQSK